jgi:hypothetical protein
MVDMQGHYNLKATWYQILHLPESHFRLLSASHCKGRCSESGFSDSLYLIDDWHNWSFAALDLRDPIAYVHI